LCWETTQHYTGDNFKNVTFAVEVVDNLPYVCNVVERKILSTSFNLGIPSIFMVPFIPLEPAA
jgi:hypothetical protein